MNKIEIDRDWLYQKYVIEDKSMKEIGEILGTSATPVRNRLKEYNISIKKLNSWKTKSPIILTPYQEEVINGALLGDGSLSLNDGNKNSTFIYTSKYKDHVEFVCKSLEEYATEKGRYKETEVYDHRTNKEYHKVTFRTQANPTFSELRNKWYLNKIKHIPNDLKLTSTVCLIWYLGDGNLRKYDVNDSQRICFATNCFLKEEINDILLPQLKDFEAIVNESSQKQKPLIIIPRRKVPDFLEYIGPCPVNSYLYKWDYAPYTHEPITNNPEKVKKIILAYKNGSNPYAIAKYFGIDRKTVLHCLEKNNIDTTLNRGSKKPISFEENDTKE